jgi:hypothetical protein
VGDRSDPPMALMLITMLLRAEQPVVYVPGRVVNTMTGALRGEGKTDLLTELSASSRRGCMRCRAWLARFAAREQRCGCAAGVVRAGGAAAGFAGGDWRAVRAVSAC